MCDFVKFCSYMVEPRKWGVYIINNVQKPRIWDRCEDMMA